jgi:hypothetical protein
MAGLLVRAQELVITEFAAVNLSGLKDEDGDFSDWIEIRNMGAQPVSLNGWSLSDDKSDLGKWRFPNRTISAQGYLIIFASGKGRAPLSGNLHTNFKLSREGGYLGLARADGSIASQFLDYPPQLAGLSYGRAVVSENQILAPANSKALIIVPTGPGIADKWMLPDFVSSAWVEIDLGAGYDRIPPGEADPSEEGPVFDITVPGDPIVPTSSNSPGNEGVTNAIDNNSATKYLNFDKLNAGFTVTPSAGPRVVTGLRLTSANDAPERDPTSFVLSGSNDGSTFIEVAHGAVPAFSSRFSTLQINFSNNVAYKQYRLLFPTVQNASAAVAMQIAEVEFLGGLAVPTAGFGQFIKTNLEERLYTKRSSVYFRVPFVLPAPIELNDFGLRIRYDDGFAAWLNGVPVARANASATLAFDSVAPSNRLRQDAIRPVRFDLNSFVNVLHEGTNILAIQGFNDRVDSPDFLMDAQLENSHTRLGDAAYFENPTPGAENSDPLAGVLEDLYLGQEHGFYESPFNLVISCPSGEAMIRYTTDGSVPSQSNGSVYSAPIPISKTTILKAAAFREGWHSSRVATRTYIFLDDVAQQTRATALTAGFPSSWGGQAADYGLDSRVIGPAAFSGKYAKTFKSDLLSLPAMSIVMKSEDMFGPQGIYSNPTQHGEAWERAASVEMIYPDHRAGFQKDAGIRIQGGAFRNFSLTLKKSFRVVFRDKYGASSLKFPLFGSEAAGEFKNFTLRANSNDGWPYGGGSALYVRDLFASTSIREMGNVASHANFVHLYINGQYWGLYNPTERPDAAFSATYYGGDSETWDSINQDSAPDGNYDAWNRMLAQVSQGLSSNAAYQKIQGNNPDGSRNAAYEDLLDVDNMIDYLVMNFYIGNGDWPGRNWWAGRDRNNGDGFKFHPWDSETALGLTGLSADSTGVSGAVAAPYAAIRSNSQFRLRFADHVYRHFFNGGVFYVNPSKPAWDPLHPENNRPAARLFALSEQIRQAMVGESARWGDQLNSSPYTRDENWLAARNSLLKDYFPQRSAIVLAQFRRAGLYPKTDAPVMNVHGGTVDPGFQLVLTAAVGTIYFTTTGLDPTNSAAATRYTGPLTINDLTAVKARVLNGTEWSALNEATFVPGKPLLTVTELNFHPAKPSAEEIAAGFDDSDFFEYIELHNPGNATYDLAGVAFVNGIQFNFSDAGVSRLGVGQFLLLVKNKGAFEKRYGSGLPVAGEYSGKLDNSGEKIEAVNARQELVLSFSYGVKAPWPATPDGLGPSLEVIDAAGDLNSASNWRASAISGGSPGKANPEPATILEVTRTTSELRITFRSRAGRNYTLLTTDTLSLDDWQQLQQGTVANADGTVTLNVAISSAAQFFRISFQ